MELEIKQITDQRQEVCENILRSLPQWFGIESAIKNYIKDVASMDTFGAFDSKIGCVGFLSVNFHNENNAEIHVIGVLPDFHGRNIGSRLVSEAANHARQKGAKFLTVKTLSPARVNKEYDLTRKFYLSVGFLPLEEFKLLWGEANPCLQMIKVL